MMMSHTENDVDSFYTLCELHSFTLLARLLSCTLFLLVVNYRFLLSQSGISHLAKVVLQLMAAAAMKAKIQKGTRKYCIQLSKADRRLCRRNKSHTRPSQHAPESKDKPPRMAYL